MVRANPITGGYTKSATRQRYGVTQIGFESDTQQAHPGIAAEWAHQLLRCAEWTPLKHRPKPIPAVQRPTRHLGWLVSIATDTNHPRQCSTRLRGILRSCRGHGGWIGVSKLTPGHPAHSTNRDNNAPRVRVRINRSRPSCRPTSPEVRPGPRRWPGFPRDPAPPGGPEPASSSPRRACARQRPLRRRPGAHR